MLVPGVGAAGAAMAALERGRPAARDPRRRPQAADYVFGICLGMQLLFERSDEGDVECLGLLPGRVASMGFAGRLPHMGWNDVVAERRPSARGRPAGRVLLRPLLLRRAGAAADVVATTELDGHRFASMAGPERIAGTQFHPEKSGPAGRELLRSFLRWSGDAA